MDKRLTTYLVEKYPLIFKDIGGEIECGSGWFWLIDALCANIANGYQNAVRQREFDIENGRIPPDEELDEIAWPHVVQVKEKFGGLRFYTANDMEGWGRDTASYVYMAEAISYRTCENCGCPATLNDGGWMRVECDACGRSRQSEDGEGLRRFGDDCVQRALAMLERRNKAQEF